MQDSQSVSPVQRTPAIENPQQLPPLHILPDPYSVCQITDPAGIPFADEFVFVGKTDDELSLVCRTASVPLRTNAREDGWSAIKIQGILDFALVGILSRIASILAEAEISIFAVSTYNTDYILLKTVSLQTAKTALEANGYEVSTPDSF